MPIIIWLLYGDHRVAPLCRSSNGSIWAITNIEKHIPAGSRVLVDDEGPVLRSDEETLEKMIQLAEELPAGPFTQHAGTYYEYQLRYQKGITYRLTELNHLWWEPQSRGEGAQNLTGARDADMGNPIKARGVEPLGTYLSAGVRYVVLNSLMTRKYLGCGYPVNAYEISSIFSRHRSVHLSARKWAALKSRCSTMWPRPEIAEVGSNPPERMANAPVQHFTTSIVLLLDY